MAVERELKDLLEQKHWTLSTCESLTCGMIADRLGGVPGVSAVYKGGFVTYCNEQKQSMAGVSKETLDRSGAVSEPCAREMCLGTAERTGTDAAISATGNAGPDASEGKPVGLVYIGVAIRGKASVKEYHFEGDRPAIRKQAAEAALQDILDRLTELRGSRE